MGKKKEKKKQKLPFETAKLVKTKHGYTIKNPMVFGMGADGVCRGHRLGEKPECAKEGKPAGQITRYKDTLPVKKPAVLDFKK